MFRSLLQLSWKEFWRSFSLAKNLLVGIMKGFMAVYFSSIVVVLGFFFPKVATEFFPSFTVMEIVNRGVIYFLLIDFLLRVLVLSGPSIAIEQLLVLPIRKSTIVKYFLSRSLATFNNFLPLLFGIPFLIVYLIPEQGWIEGIDWLVLLTGLTLTNHFLALYYLRQEVKKPYTAVIGILVVAGLIYLDGFQGVPVLQPVVDGISGLSGSGLGILTGIALPFVAGYLTFKFFIKNMYLPSGGTQSYFSGVQYTLPGLSRLGKVGHLVQLDFQLILRNKRARSAILAILIFLPLFILNLLFSGDSAFSEGAGLLFLAIFISGILQLNLNQFLYAWDGSYFDFILAGKVRLKDYLAAKFFTSMLLSVLSFMLISPIFWWLPHTWPYFVAGLLYNIGVLSFVYLFVMTYNRNAIQLDKSSFFNYEGSGYVQYLLVIPVFLPAVFLYLPFYFLGKEMIGILLIIIVSLMGIIFYKKGINLIARQFEKQKYKMAAAFKKK